MKKCRSTASVQEQIPVSNVPVAVPSESVFSPAYTHERIVEADFRHISTRGISRKIIAVITYSFEIEGALPIGG